MGCIISDHQKQHKITAPLPIQDADTIKTPVNQDQDINKNKITFVTDLPRETVKEEEFPCIDQKIVSTYRSFEKKKQQGIIELQTQRQWIRHHSGQIQQKSENSQEHQKNLSISEQVQNNENNPPDQIIQQFPQLDGKFESKPALNEIISKPKLFRMVSLQRAIDQNMNNQKEVNNKQESSKDINFDQQQFPELDQKFESKPVLSSKMFPLTKKKNYQQNDNSKIQQVHDQQQHSTKRQMIDKSILYLRNNQKISNKQSKQQNNQKNVAGQTQLQNYFKNQSILPQKIHHQNNKIDISEYMDPGHNFSQLKFSSDQKQLFQNPFVRQLANEIVHTETHKIITVPFQNSHNIRHAETHKIIMPQQFMV